MADMKAHPKDSYLVALLGLSQELLLVEHWVDYLADMSEPLTESSSVDPKESCSAVPSAGQMADCLAALMGFLTDFHWAAH